MQLQSENPNKRFEACEELRVAPSITDEALDALRELRNDPNDDVADAAQRALAMHINLEITHDQPQKIDSKELSGEHQSLTNYILWLLIIFGFLLTPIVLWVWWFVKVDISGGYKILVNLWALMSLWILHLDYVLRCFLVPIFAYLPLILIGCLLQRLLLDQDHK